MDAKTWFGLTHDEKLAHVKKQLFPSNILTPELAVEYTDAWLKENPNATLLDT